MHLLDNILPQGAVGVVIISLQNTNLSIGNQLYIDLLVIKIYNALQKHYDTFGQVFSPHNPFEICIFAQKYIFIDFDTNKDILQFVFSC